MGHDLHGSPLRSARLSVFVEEIPDVPDDSKEWADWCGRHNMSPLNSGRRAWSSDLGEYVKDAKYLVYGYVGAPLCFARGEELVF